MSNLIKNTEVYDIPLNEIFSDMDFNCRAEITDSSVETLAQSIEINGLQSPIHLQQKEGLPEGKFYRIIAGHRRFAAVNLLDHLVIKSILLSDLNEQQAKILNLSENIDRENLTPYEEAMALTSIFPSQTPTRKMATILKRSPEWCRRRLMIMKYPKEIQLGFHSGLLGIRDAIALDGLAPETRLDAARRLIKARENGNKRDIPGGTVKQRVPHKTTTDIRDMIDYFLRKNIDSLPVKTLLWVLGVVDIKELKTLTRQAEKNHSKALYIND